MFQKEGEKIIQIMQKENEIFLFLKIITKEKHQIMPSESINWLNSEEFQHIHKIFHLTKYSM